MERRAHSLPFKLKVVAQALRRNAVVADVAQRNGIHSNLLRQWISAVKLAFPKS